MAYKSNYLRNLYGSGDNETSPASAFKSNYFRSGQQSGVKEADPVEVERIKIDTTSPAPARPNTSELLAAENEYNSLTEELSKINNGTAIYTDEGKARAAEIEVELKGLRNTIDNLSNSADTDYSEYLNQKYKGTSDIYKALTSVGKSLVSAPGVVVETTKTAAQNTKNNYATHTPEDDETAALVEELAKINNGTAIYTDEGKARAREIEARLAELRSQDASVDMNSAAMRNYSEAGWLQNEATKNIESPVGKFFANTGLSIAQNAALLPLAVVNPAAPLVAMGTVAAADKMYNVSESGGSAGEALGRGIVSGGIEALTEKVPLDSIMDLVKTGGKSAVKNLLKQAGVEATEEGLSYTMNYIADKAVNDPNAMWSWSDFANSVASGGLSGLFFGLGGTVIGNTNTQTAANPENRPTTPRTDVPLETTPSEQKTAPNAVNGAEAEYSNVGLSNNTRLSDSDLSEYLQVGVRQHVRNAKDAMVSSGDSPILTTPEKVKAFIKDSIIGKVRDTIKGYGRVGQKFQSDVSSKSNGETDISGYYLELDSNRMQHLSDHIQDDGDTRNIPLTEDQVLSIPDYIDSYDDVLDVITRKDGQTRIYLGKQINGHSVVVVLASKGRNSIQPVTAWQNTTDHYLKKYGKTKTQIDTSQPQTNGLEPRGYKPASSATTVPQTEPVVKSGDTESVGATPSGYGRNTVGAAEAQFKYQEAPTQSVADNLFTEQERQDYDLQNKHQVYTDAQANALADQLLVQDYEGEVSRLRDPDAVWDKTANVEGHRILENLIAKARKSGRESDWDAVREWKALYDRKGGTEHAQALQGRTQFATSTAEIVAEAAETLEGPDVRKLKPQKKAQLLDEVYTQAEAYNGIEKGDLNSLISLIERNNEIRRTTGFFSKKTAKQMDWALHQVAEKYPDTAEQFLRDIAVAQIRNIASDYNKVGVTEAAKSVRIMNMLSKISTVMRNLVSNNIFDPLEAISGDVGVIADLIMSKMTGQRTTTIDRSWISKAKWSGSLEGALKSYIEVGLDAPAEDATSRYEGSGSGRTFKMTGNLLERLLSTWSKYENYALQTTDEFQKGGIRAEAQRQIDSLKASGRLKDDALKDWANETARQRTFQNDSTLSKMATGLRDIGNLAHVGSIGAGDIFLPFARVPANLVSQSANYSPLGFANDMRQVVEVMIDAKRGVLDAEKQAQVARNFGRGVTGTALLAGFAALAAKGLIDVAGADDADKEALEKAQGKTGTQWNLSATLRALNGGDTTWKDDDLLMSIGFLDPLNSIMAAGSLLADDYAEKGKLTIGGIGEATVGSLWQSLVDLPAVTSLNDIINAHKYSDAETGAGKVWDTIVDYGGSQLASFVVPNALRGIATGLDDTVRNQYSGETAKETTLDSIKSGVPGLRKTLPASLDPFGREKTQTGNTLLNFLNNNILPGSVTKYSETSVEKVLENLYSVTGEAGIYPDRKAPNSFSVDKEKITLDADDKDRFMKVAGSTAESLMNDLVNSETFASASKEEQAAYFALANEYARAMAKYDLTNGRYELSGFAKSAAEAKESGIDVSDYLMYYNGKPKYNTDGKDGYTNAENLKAVEESGLTGEALTALYMITFPSWVEGAEKRGVSFESYLEYKKATNGASKKADKISALVAAGYTQAEANRLYKEME